MNRSKLLTTTALATVMSATAAHAELSLSGFYAATIADSDGGTSHGTSTSSMYVTYSDTLDNGMGLTFNISASAGWHGADVFIDTGMGTLGLGDGQDSAVDKTDGSPAITSLNKYGPRFGTSFNDGDAASGASVMYTSPSINGFTVKVSKGFEVASAASTAGVCYDTDATDSTLVAVTAGNTCATTHTRLSGSAATAGHDGVMSYAVTGSVMGLGLAAGVSSIDYHATGTADVDPSFVTASYSLGGINLGYAMYDADGSSEETQMGVSTSMGGMTVGVTFAEDDNTTDVDYMHVGAIKSLGAMSYSVEYLETDSAAAAGAGDSDTWNFTYTIGF
tara:strand:- start:38 stop:1039 length:1002 start_codon:yes stop_codon:yes gene_type:complete